MLNPEKICHENLTNLSASPVRCSHFTLGNPKKSFSIVLFTNTSDYSCYLRRKQTVILLSTPTENVTTLTCELQNFFIGLKVRCVLSNVWGSEESQLCVVIGGSWKNRLWCVATGMSGKQCHSKCSGVTTFCVSTCFQSFSTLISRIVHHAVLKFSPCCNKPLLQASTCSYQYTRSSSTRSTTAYSDNRKH